MPNRTDKWKLINALTPALSHGQPRNDAESRVVEGGSAPACIEKCEKAIPLYHPRLHMVG